MKGPTEVSLTRLLVRLHGHAATSALGSTSVNCWASALALVLAAQSKVRVVPEALYVAHRLAQRGGADWITQIRFLRATVLDQHQPSLAHLAAHLRRTHALCATPQGQRPALDAEQPGPSPPWPLASPTAPPPAHTIILTALYHAATLGRWIEACRLMSKMNAEGITEIFANDVAAVAAAGAASGSSAVPGLDAEGAFLPTHISLVPLLQRVRRNPKLRHDPTLVSYSKDLIRFVAALPPPFAQPPSAQPFRAPTDEAAETVPNAPSSSQQREGDALSHLVDWVCRAPAATWLDCIDIFSATSSVALQAPAPLLAADGAGSALSAELLPRPHFFPSSGAIALTAAVARARSWVAACSALAWACSPTQRTTALDPATAAHVVRPAIPEVLRAANAHIGWAGTLRLYCAMFIGGTCGTAVPSPLLGKADIPAALAMTRLLLQHSSCPAALARTTAERLIRESQVGALLVSGGAFSLSAVGIGSQGMGDERGDVSRSECSRRMQRMLSELATATAVVLRRGVLLSPLQQPQPQLQHRAHTATHAANDVLRACAAGGAWLSGVQLLAAMLSPAAALAADLEPESLSALASSVVDEDVRTGVVLGALEQIPVLKRARGGAEGVGGAQAGLVAAASASLPPLDGGWQAALGHLRLLRAAACRSDGGAPQPSPDLSWKAGPLRACPGLDGAALWLVHQLASPLSPKHASACTDLLVVWARHAEALSPEVLTALASLPGGAFSSGAQTAVVEAIFSWAATPANASTARRGAAVEAKLAISSGSSGAGLAVRSAVGPLLVLVARPHCASWDTAAGRLVAELEATEVRVEFISELVLRLARDADMTGVRAVTLLLSLPAPLAAQVLLEPLLLAARTFLAHLLEDMNAPVSPPQLATATALVRLVTTRAAAADAASAVAASHAHQCRAVAIQFCHLLGATAGLTSWREALERVSELRPLLFGPRRRSPTHDHQWRIDAVPPERHGKSRVGSGSGSGSGAAVAGARLSAAALRSVLAAVAADSWQRAVEVLHSATRDVGAGAVDETELNECFATVVRHTPVWDVSLRLLRAQRRAVGWISDEVMREVAALHLQPHPVRCPHDGDTDSEREGRGDDGASASAMTTTMPWEVALRVLCDYVRCSVLPSPSVVAAWQAPIPREKLAAIALPATYGDFLSAKENSAQRLDCCPPPPLLATRCPSRSCE